VDAVEAYRDADHQHVILALGDVHSVGVPDPEPGSGDLREHTVAVADLEVLADYVADGF
jgi:hypothetical protein